MNSLHFTFKSGENIIYDEKVVTSKKDEYLNFNLDDQLFKIRLKEKFHFVKENEEEIFEIVEEDSIKVLITLKNHQNAVFEIKVTNFEYKIFDEKYIINYTIESDDEILKTIILQFE